MPIGGTNVIQTFRVWLNADQQLNEGVTRIELKWKVYNQPRWPSDDDDDEGLLEVVAREKSPKARCESLKGTGFGVGAPSFGASAANFGWMLALLYKSLSTSLNSPMSPSFSLLHSLVPRQKWRWWEMSPTVTRQLLIVDYSAHHYQIFSHCEISGSLMSCTGDAFGHIARDLPISKWLSLRSHAEAYEYQL